MTTKSKGLRMATEQESDSVEVLSLRRAFEDLQELALDAITKKER